MIEFLSGPASIVAVFLIWFLIQAVVLPRLGIST